MTTERLVALSFLGVILTGALLLTLPISSKTGDFTAFSDCLFTATSATCVTGLVVVDTFTHWSVFGQLVVLLLIQIGGLSFMTLITIFAIFTKKHISLKEMNILTQSAGNVRRDAVITLIKGIIFGTLIVEATGTLFLSFCLCPEVGAKGVYYAMFHSVSAFCNAGFDLMGFKGEFSSLTSYVDNVAVNSIIMVLIVVGGLGFFVWTDLIKCKFRFKKLEMHSKIVISTTAVLILFGAVCFFIFEYAHSLKDLPLGDKILASFFQSVTTRTAGFNTIDQSALSDSGKLTSVFLMITGGSPGSTAGGIKTTTLAVIIISTIAGASNHENSVIFKKKIAAESIKQAHTIATTYIIFAVVSTCLICAFEPHIPLSDILFEVASAIGTVGLTTGITPTLSEASKIVLIILMYAGRLGAMTLMLVLSERHSKVPLDRPSEKVIVG